MNKDLIKKLQNILDSIKHLEVASTKLFKIDIKILNTQIDQINISRLKYTAVKVKKDNDLETLSESLFHDIKILHSLLSSILIVQGNNNFDHIFKKICNVTHEVYDTCKTLNKFHNIETDNYLGFIKTNLTPYIENLKTILHQLPSEICWDIDQTTTCSQIAKNDIPGNLNIDPNIEAAGEGSNHSLDF